MSQLFSSGVVLVVVEEDRDKCDNWPYGTVHVYLCCWERNTLAFVCPCVSLCCALL